MLRVESLEERTPLSATGPKADFSLTAAGEPDATLVQKAIVAGDPDGSPVDSPANRVDPNTVSSAFGGVGSLFMDLGNGTGFLCTGTLISPRHVLTAGHCVDVDDNGSADFAPGNVSFFLNYGSDFSHTLTASALYVHPDFTGFANPSVLDDLTVVELSSPAPAGVPIYQINTAPFINIETITLAGYGTTGDAVNGYISGSASFTVKRTGMNRADVFLSDDEGTGTREGYEWDFDGDHKSTNVFGPPQSLNLTLGNDLETTVGGGDSGGPSFIDDGNGGLLVFGVNTFTASRKAPAPLFGSVGGGIVVSTYADWINSITAVTPAAVVGRRIFYNQSNFDGNDSGINAGDDAAIATDKIAYLPGGGAASDSSVSSYSRGVNGVMVDVADASGTITAADFTFKLGDNNAPSTWALAPAPSAVSVRPGAGTSGSDRVEIIWNDGDIANAWLQVIVEGNDAAGGFNTNTGLAASDTFFFGSRIGDTLTDDLATTLLTSAADEIAARNNLGFEATISNIFDFNRDSLVSAADEIIARNNVGFTTRIDISSPPADPEAAPARAAVSGGGLASASLIPPPSLPAPHDSTLSLPTRLRTTDSSSGPITDSFQPLQEADDPRAVAAFEATDPVVESWDLDDTLLDWLTAELLP